MELSLKITPTAADEFTFKFPFDSPFFKGNFIRVLLTHLWKRNEGEIYGAILLTRGT
jgi:hypothetical protein